MSMQQSPDVIAATQVIIARVKAAVDSRNTDALLAVIPEDDAVVGKRYRASIYGVMQHLFKNDLPGFLWLMEQISTHNGHENFTARFWIGAADRLLP